MEQAWRLNLFPIQALHWSSEVRSQQRERSWRKHWAPPLSLIRTVRALIPAKLRFVANDSRWLNLARDKWPWDRMCSVSCQLLRSMPHFSRPSHLTGLALITLPSYPPSTAGWREGTRPLTSLLRNETRFNGLSITFSYFNHVPLANNFNCLIPISTITATNLNRWRQLLVKLCASLQLQGTSAPCWELWMCVNGREWLFTVELGVLVPYPDEGRDAKDHRRPSALQRKQMSLKSPMLSIHVVQKNPVHIIFHIL